MTMLIATMGSSCRSTRRMRMPLGRRVSSILGGVNTTSGPGAGGLLRNDSSGAAATVAVGFGAGPSAVGTGGTSVVAFGVAEHATAAAASETTNSRREDRFIISGVPPQAAGARCAGGGRDHHDHAVRG